MIQNKEQNEGDYAFVLHKNLRYNKDAITTWYVVWCSSYNSKNASADPVRHVASSFMDMT